MKPTARSPHIFAPALAFPLSSLLLLALLGAACGGGQTDATPVTSTPPQGSQPAPVDEPIPTLQLPTDVHAIREKLDLTIDPNAQTYGGSADLDVTMDKDRDGLWLHGRELHVTKVTVSGAAGANLTAGWEQKDPSGVNRVVFPKMLPAGALHVHVEFDAKYADGLQGLYIAKQSGTSYAVTEFEPVDARRAFPCMDEPSAKIPWDVTLTVPKGDQVVSNGPEVSRTDKGANVRVQFASTPPLPSYLVAFAVGPFDIVKAADVPANGARSKPLPLRLLAAKGRGPELSYAAQHTGEILSTLETYFGIAYPYDKLDMIAVPDMNGAMENAGAVTYSESILLFDEKTAPIWQLRDFAETVAHELAHQWFGDLVTTAWWDDIWLNEAFATWMEAKASDKWNPQTEGHLALLEGMQGAMSKDSEVAARAVRQPIRSLDDVTNAFDDITYEKGGAVIGMFEHFIGEEPFRQGVHSYLEAHRFGTATVADFTAALSKAAGRDIDAPMRTFLDVPGVPMVEVQMLCDGVPRLHVKQSRYLPTGSSGNPAQTWQIPLCTRYQTDGKLHDSCMLFQGAEADLPLEGDKCPTWVMPNAHGAGYYRLLLSREDFARLRGPAFDSLDMGERVAYANAIRVAENRNSMPFGELVEASAVLAKDPHAAIASEAGGTLAEARDFLFGSPLQAKVEARARALYASQAQALGTVAKAGEDPDRAQLRGTILRYMLTTGRDPKTRAALGQIGSAYVAGGQLHPEVASPELLGPALLAYFETAGAAGYEQGIALLKTVNEGQVRGRLIAAMATAQSTPELRNKVRALALDPILRTDETLRPLWSEFGEVDTREEAWQWLKTNYDALTKRTNGELFGAVRVLSMPESFCDESHAMDVEKFFTPKMASMSGGTRALAETVESIRLCTAKRDKLEHEMKPYFGGK